MTTYYKALNKDHRSSIKNKPWSLPGADGPGEWMPPVEGDLKICRNGYHVITADHLIDWIDAHLYVAEVGDEIVEGDNKVAARTARLIKRIETWNEKSARLFACDCAERVIDIYEKYNDDDDRPRKTIEIARAYANGHASVGQLDAAWAAAWDAAGDAAGDAARAAARAAAWDAARAAARAAAWAAARAAAWAAAGDDERKWQTTRLLYYLEI